MDLEICREINGKLSGRAFTSNTSSRTQPQPEHQGEDCVANGWRPGAGGGMVAHAPQARVARLVVNEFGQEIGSCQSGEFFSTYFCQQAVW